MITIKERLIFQVSIGVIASGSGTNDTGVLQIQYDSGVVSALKSGSRITITNVSYVNHDPTTTHDADVSLYLNGTQVSDMIFMANVGAKSTLVVQGPWSVGQSDQLYYRAVHGNGQDLHLNIVAWGYVS